MPYADPKSERAILSRRAAALRAYYRNREDHIRRAREWSIKNKDRVADRARKQWVSLSIQTRIFKAAKMRAARDGVPFNITIEDIVVPEVCPALGIKLEASSGHAKDCSPSLDKIIPHLGYVRGNIRVISHRANTIKSDATAAELRAVLSYVEEMSREPTERSPE